MRTRLNVFRVSGFEEREQAVTDESLLPSAPEIPKPPNGGPPNIGPGRYLPSR